MRIEKIACPIINQHNHRSGRTAEVFVNFGDTMPLEIMCPYYNAQDMGCGYNQPAGAGIRCVYSLGWQSLRVPESKA